MTHWMARAAIRAGFRGAEGLTFGPATPPGDIWATTIGVCGVEPDELAVAVASAFRVSVADLDAAEPTAAKLIPESIARRFGVFPVRYDDKYVVVATSNPTDPKAEQEVGFAAGRRPDLAIAPPDGIAVAIESTYSPEVAAASLLSKVGDEFGDIVNVEVKKEGEDAPEEITEADTAVGPIVSLANIILHEAVARDASDIHIQPMAGAGVVRFRTDGILHNGMQMPLSVLTRIVSRIKIMSNLDITDRMRPQDGRARIVVDGNEYDLRVSTVPTRGAEKAVIRVLGKLGTGTLDGTGIVEEELGRIRRALSTPDGIFVVTGPTGSGKTTTLYGALQEISSEDVNIMTVEDPVEYEVPHLTQIQVEPKQGVTFASALRAILRQDPDVILVGEIRDSETAEIAAQASLTGHLVLASLHTNDAVGSIRRFIDLGLDPATVSETLRATLAQRLVRRVCPHCAQPAPEPLTMEEQALQERFGCPVTIRQKGCDRCAGQGYLGRLPITEFLNSSPDLVRLILDGAPQFELQRQATRDGMRTLLESALARVRAGQTTLEEVERVLGATDEADKHTAGGGKGSNAASNGDAQVTGRPEFAAPPPAATQRPPPAEPPRHESSPPLGEPDTEDEAPHVLLVDDDGTVRTIARGMLEKIGYRVSEATDGSEALARLVRGEHFTLMILDLDMPMLGGREVLRAVRRSLATAGLPVVVLTGTPDPDAEIELMEEGADDYIRKPIDPPRFLTRVKAVVRRAGA